MKKKEIERNQIKVTSIYEIIWIWIESSKNKYICLYSFFIVIVNYDFLENSKFCFIAAAYISSIYLRNVVVAWLHLKIIWPKSTFQHTKHYTTTYFINQTQHILHSPPAPTLLWLFLMLHILWFVFICNFIIDRSQDKKNIEKNTFKIVKYQ